MQALPSRMFSAENPKASKSVGFGYLNAIMYLAPHDLAGVGNLCPHASAGCAAACLGFYSGRADMVRNETDINTTRAARILKAQAFMKDRAGFMRNVALDIARNAARAKREKLKLAVRLNGSADIAFEGIALVITVDDAKAINRAARGALSVEPGFYRNIFAAFPSLQFLDYTKNPKRMARALPPNYHLTFSRSESNDAAVTDVLATRANVAVVFDKRPRMFRGRRVINGDKHDLRFLDPRGVIVGLTPKGRKAAKDASGFIVRRDVNQSNLSQ